MLSGAPKKNWSDTAFGPLINPVFLVLVCAPLITLGYVWLSQNILN